MLADMINTLVALAHQNAEFKRTQLPGNRIQVRSPDGEVAIYDEDAPQLVQHAYNYEAICDWAEEHGSDALRFYVGQERLMVTYRERELPKPNLCYLDYELTAAYDNLLGWIRNPQQVEQVVRLLRGYLYGTCSSHLLAIFRRMTFAQSSSVGKTIKHTGSSLGKEVEHSAVASEGEIPETITFRLDLYRSLPVAAANINCSVEVDPQTETVRLNPIGDCLADANQVVYRELVFALKEAFPEALVIHGLSGKWN